MLRSSTKREAARQRATVQAEPRISPTTIADLLRRTTAADLPCRVELASLLLQRMDKHPVESERRYLRLVAATHLDAGGVSEGRRLLTDTYAELASAGATGRWTYLFEALSTYRGTPAWNAFLDFLADRIASEGARALPDGQYDGLHLVFAAAGRCDIVERLYPQVPPSAAPSKPPEPAKPQIPTTPLPRVQDYSCATGKAEHAWLFDPRAQPKLAQMLEDFTTRFGPKEPTLDRSGLQQALRHRDPLGRLFHLRSFVERLRNAVRLQTAAGARR